MVKNMDKEPENKMPETDPDAQTIKDQLTVCVDADPSSVIDWQS